MSLPFWEIKEGFGVTFIFGQSNSTGAVYHIGTLNCVSCVGVYLPIDADRCFVAHINAHVKGLNGKDSFTIDPKSTRAENIEKEVVRRLSSHMRAHNWSPRDVESFMESSDADPTIVCPFLDEEDTGSRVLAGLQRCFDGTGLTLKDHVLPDLRGFIVKHRTREIHPSKADGNWGEPRGISGFERVPVEGATMDWVIEA